MKFSIHNNRSRPVIAACVVSILALIAAVVGVHASADSMLGKLQIDGSTFKFQSGGSIFKSVAQSNEPIVDKYGHHEAVGLGDEIFMFGGIHENRTMFWQGSNAFVKIHADTRAFNPQTGLHRRITPVDGVEPSDRCWFASSSDGVDRFFVYGGVGTGIVNRDDLWVYSKQQNKWTKLSGGVTGSNVQQSPEQQTMASAYLEHNMGRKPTKERRSTISKAARNVQQQTTNSAANQQTVQGDVVGVSPGSLNGPAMVLDENTDELYLFGGIYSDFVSDNNNVYKFDIATGVWTRLAVAAGSPVPRGRALSEMRMRHKNGRRELVVYGGESFYMDIMYYRYTCDMWIFDIDSRTWRQLVSPVADRDGDPMVDDIPACRLHYATVYDPLYDQMHFHGGDYGGCKCTDLITDRTVVYDFGNNRFADDVYGRIGNVIPGFGTGFDMSGPYIKRAKLTTLNNGDVYMTGGYVARQPGNADQQYPGTIYKYQPRNIFTTLLKTPIGGLVFQSVSQDVVCPADDDTYC